MNTDGKVRRKGLGVRRKTIDGRRLTAAQAHARSSPVVGRKKKNTHHKGTKTPREESQGGQGDQGEKILTTEDTEGTKGKRCKLPAQRSRRKEGCGLWIIRPCFRPPIVRMVPGHRGKILTTEITEVTKGTEG
jgi:hypothetical protein